MVLGWLNQREFKIFLSFLIIYIIFIKWGSWGEDSYLNLARALVDEGRLEIDSYYQNTGDRSFYKGHYYSDKPPGLSFLAAPLYAFAKLIFPQERDPTLVILDPRYNVFTNFTPSDYVLASMIFSTSLSSIFTALTIILLYRISEYFVKDERFKMVGVIAFGVGSLAFPSATVFRAETVGMFFSFLSFYMLLKIKKEEISSNYYKILSGLSIGLAILFSYLSLFVFFACLFYFLFAFRKNLKSILFYLAGFSLGILPLLFYNFLIFGNIFDTSYFHIDKSYVAFKKTPYKFLKDYQQAPNKLLWILFTHINFDSLDYHFLTLMNLLFSPYRGLFFYYPVFLLSLPGILFMYKKYRAEALTIVFLLIISFWSLSTPAIITWYGGTSFGPRFFTPLIPFLIIPMLFAFRRINFILVSLLLLISIVINFIGLQNWEVLIEEKELQTKEQISPIYRWIGEDKYYFHTLNPIFDYYLPLFSKNGPRSTLLEGFLDPEPGVDIRGFTRNPITQIKLGATRYGILLMHNRFLLVLIFAALCLLWRKELAKYIRKYIRLKYLVFIPLILTPYLFTFFFSFSNLVYDRNWYTKEDIGYWMSQNATISIFSPTREEARFEIFIDTYHKERTLNLYLNDNFIGSYLIYKETYKIVSPKVELLPGENVLKFNSKEGCNRPCLLENSTDWRCLSFLLKNFKILKKEQYENESLLLMNYWYEVEDFEHVKFRWMSQNATILIFSLEEAPSVLSFKAKSYNTSRELRIYLNDVLLYNVSIDHQSFSSISIPMKLVSGENVLKFNSKEGCNIPANLGVSEDRRCLSFAIGDLKLEIKD